MLFWNTDDHCEDPDNFKIRKIKYERSALEKQTNQIPDTIIKLGILVGMDNTKHIHIITTYKFMEFLGDISGFKEFIEIIFGLFGFYISSSLFKADFVDKFFESKLVQDETKVGDDSIVIFSYCHVLLEPIVSFFI